MRTIIASATVTAPQDIGVARHLVDRLLGGVDEEQRLVVELVVSELATNALLHAGRTCEVRVVAVDDGRLRVEVDDPEVDRLPAPRTPGPHDVTGRGLRIVDRLAERWGVDRRGPVKTVWCELPPPERAAVRARPTAAARPCP